jgi:hypothetical protein
MSSILRAGLDAKGGRFYGDSSSRTAYLRKQAVISGQVQKTGNPATSTTTAAQAMKPLISEHHLTKGIDNGVKEIFMLRNPSGFF